MFKVTLAEMEMILDALNIAGASDPKYDDLYDELVEREECDE